MTRPDASGPPRASSSAPRTLLIDDEQAFARTLAKRISLRGRPCDVAFDGRSGLDMLQRIPYANLLLDLRLPDLDGRQVLSLALAQQPALRVIIVTAHGGEKEESECRALGAMGFLNKPLDLGELLETLDALPAPAVSTRTGHAPEDE